MKLKKPWLIPLTIISAPILPLVVVSCSSTADPAEMFSKINMWINEEKIIPIIKFKNQTETTNIDIRNLDFSNFEKQEVDYDIEWKIQKEKIEKDEELKDIEWMINNEIKTTFSHFYVPKLNQDQETPVFFQIELINVGGRGQNKKQDFSFKLKDLARFNSLTFKNLSADNLKTLINDKLNQTPSLVANLSNIITSYYVDNFDAFLREGKIKQDKKGDQITKQTIVLDQTVLDLFVDEITRTSKYFNQEHNEQNLFILNEIQADDKTTIESQKDNPIQFVLDLQISTSEKTKANNVVSNLKLPFIIPTKVNK